MICIWLQWQPNSQLHTTVKYVKILLTSDRLLQSVGSLLIK